MNFDPVTLVPSPKNWFSTIVEYQGNGKAVFFRPSGSIEGLTTVRFDEFGEYNIEMEVENFTPESPMIFGLIQFLGGKQPTKGENTIQMSFGTLENQCIKLTVITQDGVFSAEGDIHFSFSQLNLLGSSKGTKIELFLNK